MRAPSDQALHDQLASHRPEEFDAFMEAVYAAVHELRPRLMRFVRSLRTGLEAEDVVGLAVDRALDHLLDQWRGRETTFAFLPEHGLTFATWMLQIIGRPGAGRRSGVIGEMLRQRQREAAVIDWTADLDAVGTAAPAPEQAEDPAEHVERAVEALPARDQFVIRATFGLHGLGHLNADAIAQLARQVGFAPAAVRTIARRAKALRAAPATTLSRGDIGLLLDVGDRQVGNIKAASLERLTHACALDSELS